MSDSFATPWTVACQAHLSMEFSKQDHWSGLPFLTPGDLPDPRFRSGSPAWQADSLPLSHQESLYEVYLELNSFIRALVMCFSLFTNSVELNKALPEKLLATSKTEARMANCFNWDSMSRSRILSISRVW